MAEQLLIGRSRFPSARPARCVAANAVPGLESALFMRVLAPHEPSFRQQAMRSIRKVANGFALTILLLFAAATVALLISRASSTQIEGANPTSSMQQTINDFATLLVKRTVIADDKGVA
jgi:hypothetical protein